MSIELKDKLVTLESLGVVYDSEVNDRNAAIAAEATARADAISAEIAARTEAIANEVTARNAAIVEAINQAETGAPTKVELVSQMTNPDKNYLYIGEEQGYNSGHIYYLVDGAPVDKGVFGGTNIDDTLTISGQAADAKVTGDKIEEIKEDLNDNTELVKKTAIKKTVYTGNVVNTVGKTAPGASLDGSIHFVLPDGTYYTNPWVDGTRKSILLYPKDSDGKSIEMTRYRASGTNKMKYVEINISLARLDVAELTITCFFAANTSYYEAGNGADVVYELDAEPAYWEFRGGGFTEGEPIECGFTQDKYKPEFVPYVDPTIELIYSEGLNKHIDSKIDNVESRFMMQSYNLLDYEQIVWMSYNGRYPLVKGYYMPVDEGDVLTSNNTSIGYYFYDESYTQLSTAGASVSYLPVTVPASAKWFRIDLNIGFVSKGDPVMVWKAKNEVSARFERPIFRPTIQYKPNYFDGSIFDYAVPTSLNQGVIRWARFAALRAMNEARDAYRFGTFNTYVSRGSKGFPVIREMLFDYGIDFCGFQECNYAGTVIGSAVYDFQFPYNSGARYETDAVPCVSRFEVTSSSAVALKDGNHWCKIVKMNLPQNKHYPRVPTLSVYNYHGSLALSNRLAEIQDILTIIASDTSDFIVIMGDTNSEVDSAGHRQSWDAWEAAGFKAVHHGESPTWPSIENPSRYSSMDNIFVSEHINVLHYDIINGPYLKLEDGTTTLSDHDFVFADLQFDFDEALKDTWEEPATVN